MTASAVRRVHASGRAQTSTQLLQQRSALTAIAPDDSEQTLLKDALLSLADRALNSEDLASQQQDAVFLQAALLAFTDTQMRDANRALQAVLPAHRDSIECVTGVRPSGAAVVFEGPRAEALWRQWVGVQESAMTRAQTRARRKLMSARRKAGALPPGCMSGGYSYAGLFWLLPFDTTARVALGEAPLSESVLHEMAHSLTPFSYFVDDVSAGNDTVEQERFAVDRLLAEGSAQAVAERARGEVSGRRRRSSYPMETSACNELLRYCPAGEDAGLSELACTPDKLGLLGRWLVGRDLQVRELSLLARALPPGHAPTSSGSLEAFIATAHALAG